LSGRPPIAASRELNRAMLGRTRRLPGLTALSESFGPIPPHEPGAFGCRALPLSRPRGFAHTVRRRAVDRARPSKKRPKSGQFDSRSDGISDALSRREGTDLSQRIGRQA
jgi:hypothetical protein